MQPNIPVLEILGYEADDVIGTVAKKAEKEGFTVYMLTSDKDFGQLVSEHIFMYRPKFKGGYEIMGPKEIKEKYSLESHHQVIDMLGLMGDASDNIPGCPGVGEKTAIKLLQQFGSIDALLSRTDEVKGALRNKIEEHKDQILFSKFLAEIKTDVPVDFDENALKVEPINETELKALFNELEFRTLSTNKFGDIFTSLPPDQPIARVQFTPAKREDGQMSLFGNEEQENNQDSNRGDSQVQTKATIAGASQHATSSPVIDLIAAEAVSKGLNAIHNTSHEYILIDDKTKRAHLISQLFLQKSVCFDTETTGVDVFTADMIGLSFCYEKGRAYYVTLPNNKDERAAVLHEFKVFFQSEHIEKIGQNVKFDLLMLAQYDIELKGKIFDTMIAHYLLQPELRHSMDFLAEVYLKYRTIRYEDLVGAKGKNQQKYRMLR